MNEKLVKVKKALEARGFETLCFDTAAEASAFVRGDIAADALVAIGGCMTAKEMGLHTSLREDGHEVLWHWEVTPAERSELLHRAQQADVYLCSANALTEDGLMVQIDGTGNRVAAMCYGPKNVYVIIGRNKIVEGGYAQAVKRIKQIACPANARRFGFDNPCATVGKCNVAECKRSMCHAFLALEGAPGGNKTKVLLVDEDLGY